MAAQEFKQPIHGNYHAYYSKRTNPACTDPRLLLLPQDIFKGKRVLDIGCNEGWLTVDIAQRFSPAKVVGVDLDGDLIRAAWKRRRLVWSLQEPPVHHDNKGPAAPASVTSDTDQEDSAVGAKQIKKRKRMDSSADMTKGGVYPDLPGQSQTNPSPSYFPMALQHMFGPLPIPSAAVALSSTPEWKPKPFPHNITFHTADWMAAPRDMDMGIKKEDREGYDVIVAFSITKWIHLKGGDQGLLEFFRKIYRVLRSSPLKGGGLLLLEPQGWENYAKAKKLTPEYEATYKTLELRPADFPQMLRGIGFDLEASYAIGGEGLQKRSIMAFRKVKVEIVPPY